jgi:hypothetical protein
MVEHLAAEVERERFREQSQLRHRAEDQEEGEGRPKSKIGFWQRQAIDREGGTKLSIGLDPPQGSSSARLRYLPRLVQALVLLLQE